MTRLIPTHEFALYSLGGPDTAPDGGCLPFSPARYSRYKYGSVTAAEAFAEALGTAFGERHPEFARMDQYAASHAVVRRELGRRSGRPLESV